MSRASCRYCSEYNNRSTSIENKKYQSWNEKTVKMDYQIKNQINPTIENTTVLLSIEWVNVHRLGILASISSSRHVCCWLLGLCTYGTYATPVNK